MKRWERKIRRRLAENRALEALSWKPMMGGHENTGMINLKPTKSLYDWVSFIVTHAPRGQAVRLVTTAKYREYGKRDTKVFVFGDPDAAKGAAQKILARLKTGVRLEVI